MTTGNADSSVSASSLPVFLNLTGETHSGGQVSGEESGLLSLAFHPGFATNRRFFVLYSRQSPRGTVLQEFTAPAQGSPQKVGMPFYSFGCTGNHIGGQAAFAADGTLYTSSGEQCRSGSSTTDVHPAQNLENFAGKILRVNVDQRKIEVVHYGLRNPWRFSFDSTTRDLYIADVGAVYEKLLVRPFVSSIRNFGWAGNDQMAETVSTAARLCDTCTGQGGAACVACLGVTPTVSPITKSVIGGYVYRGKKIPCLQGRYIYGQYEHAEQVFSNRISSLVWTGEAVTALTNMADNINPAPRLPLNPSSFGQDGNGELYIAHYGTFSGSSGAVYRVDPR
jgi:glucose/arabinose dehydrogenase